MEYEDSFTAIRIEGSKNSIDERMQNLIREIHITDSNISILETNQSSIFWTKIKNLEFFSLTNNNIIRIVMPTSNCSKLIYQFRIY